MASRLYVTRVDPAAYARARRSGRRPVVQGLALGALVFILELVGRYGPGPVGRGVADVVGLLTGSAWIWALFAGWLGRGARDAGRAAVMGAAGLFSASLVRIVADTVVALTDEPSARVLKEQAGLLVGVGMAGPVLLGVLAATLGWLTTRRDRFGAAAGIVLGLGLSGTLAVGLQGALRGQSEVKVGVAVVGMLAGLAVAVWFAYRAVRDGEGWPGGPGAADGAPETPIRRYAEPPARGAADAPRSPAYAPTGSTPWTPDADATPTMALHHGDDGRPAYPHDEAPTQEIPVYRHSASRPQTEAGWPQSHRTPPDLADQPTRPNPTGGWHR